MGKISAAERNRKYRLKLKNEVNFSDRQQKEKINSRNRKRRQRERMSQGNKKIRAAKQKQYRQRKYKDLTENTSTNILHLRNPYATASSAGRAIAKAGASFPLDDEKRKFVWQRLGLKFGYLLPSDIRNELQLPSSSREVNTSIPQEVCDKVKSLFTRRDISYTTPGNRLE